MSPDSSWNIVAEVSDWSKLSRSLGSQPVRRLYIATEQYSSLCVSAMVLTLGGDDIEDGVPDREQADCERDDKRTIKHVTSWMACGWSVKCTLRHHEPPRGAHTCAMWMREITCEVYLSTPRRRLQWIAVDCNRNQLQRKECCSFFYLIKLTNSFPLPLRLVPQRCAW